ncbi:ATP-dependent DNA helicase DDM1-like [Hyalella azteca]|uniref:ATP-dependent DNA helicase DDM1-like n=1 Tax=Hyalella azteca TaxID=294128 RepID=A0A979FIL5_HYAAZ|nr:ATP-dependent DNA helicase DDM1-like [Hyalella azteca]
MKPKDQSSKEKLKKGGKTLEPLSPTASKNKLSQSLKRRMNFPAASSKTKKSALEDLESSNEGGLGKTVQTIAMLCHLVEKDAKGHFLVIAPLSALCNWCNDIKMFAPQLPYVLFHGNESVRCEKMKLFKKTSPVKVTLPDGSSVTRNVFPIVVTSYEVN